MQGFLFSQMQGFSPNNHRSAKRTRILSSLFDNLISKGLLDAEFYTRIPTSTQNKNKQTQTRSIGMFSRLRLGKNNTKKRRGECQILLLSSKFILLGFIADPIVLGSGFDW